MIDGSKLPLEENIALTKRVADMCNAAGVPVEGGQVSSESIKRQLLRFVQAEDPAKPLSDEALRAALEAVNLPVARRTVAKYREELGIPSSSARRRMD